MNIRLKKILEMKKFEKMTLNELIEAYLELYVKNVDNAYEEIISELIVYISAFKESLSEDALLKTIDATSSKLNIIPPQSAIIAIMQNKIARNAGLKPAVFGARAEKAISVLNERMVWVGNDARARTQRSLKAIFDKAYSGNLTHDEFMDELRNGFETFKNMETHKLKAAADFNLRQNSNLGVVQMALEHDFPYVQVVAIIDNRTTMICLSMNGRYIPTKQLKVQYENILNAKSIKAAKNSSNLNLEGKGFWEKKLPENFGIPPYHFGCRSFLRLISEAQYNVNKQWIDQFGREYSVLGGERGSTWEKIRTTKDHLPKSGYANVTELLYDTMNNVVRIGTHSGHAAMIIQGRNGFFITMNYKGEIETCFKPTENIDIYYNRFELRTYYDTSILRGIKKWLENLQ